MKWYTGWAILLSKKKRKKKKKNLAVHVWTVRTCEVVVRVKLKAVAFSSLFLIAIHHYSLSLSKLFSATFPSPTLSLSQRHKNQKRKGGMDLPNWFQALPFILLKFLNWYFHFVNLAWPYILLLLLDPLFSHFFNIEVALSFSFSQSL